MQMLNIYIPLASCGNRRQYVAGQVSDALKAQTVKNEVVECIAEGEISSQHRYPPSRITGEAAARNLCIKKAIEAGDEVFVMQDRDRVPLAIDCIEAALAAIQADETIAMLSLVEMRHCKYVDLGWAMCRLSALVKIIPIVNIYGSCLCREINEAIIKAGFKCQYLDDTNKNQRTREV